MGSLSLLRIEFLQDKDPVSGSYGNTDCQIFKWEYKIRKIFAKESTYPKEIIEF